MTPAHGEAGRLGVMGLVLATACAVPDYGAQYHSLPEVSDACLLELEVPDDIGADFAWSLFDCINQRSGYLDELESLAWYATHDEDAVAYLFAAPSPQSSDLAPEASGGDLVWTLNFTTDLVRYPTDPVDQVARMYGTLHDDYPDLLILAGSTVAALADQVANCESSWGADDASSERCHTLRLARRLLDRQDVIDDVERVFDALEGMSHDDPPQEPATWQESLRGIAGVLERATANSDNPLLELARSGIGRSDDESKLLGALALARRVLLLEDDSGTYAFDMIASENGLADHLARLWREGSLQAAPDEVDWLLSHDINGFEVPVGSDDTVVASLVSALSELTVASADDPILFDTLAEVINNLYLNDADLGELVGSLSDAISIVCNDSDAPLPESLAEVCGLAEGALPAVEAVTVYAPDTMRTGLAVVYVYTQFHRVVSEDDPSTYTLDIGLIVDAVEFISEWQELSGLDVLDDGTARDTTTGQAIAAAVDYVPLFINTDLGRITPVGEDAMNIVDFATGTWVYDEASGESLDTPIMVVAPLLRSILFADELGHETVDLDRWMEVASLALLGGSDINVEGIASLLDTVEAVTGQVDDLLDNDEPGPVDAAPGDPVADLKALIDDTSQWVPLVRIAADPVFVDLLVPHPYPHQEAWRSDAQFWIKDRLERGLMGRILDWTGNLLHSFGLGSDAEGS